MKTSYDYTKDERYKSCEKFIYNSLIDLGFRVTNVGTMYLKDLILFAYFNNYYEINVTKLVKDFMLYKKINHISYRTFINCIDYALSNCNNHQLENSFKEKFGISYNSYYNSIKYIIIILQNTI